MIRILGIRADAAGWAVALPLFFLCACGERPHLNPFDPATKVSLEIQAPDSLTMAGDTARFALVTDPDYVPVVPPVWTVRGEGVSLLDIGGGRFVFRYAPLLPTSVVITATMDGRLATKTITAVQHVAQVHLACASATYSYDRLANDYVPLCPVALDRRGNPLIATTPTVIARTPGVVDIPNWPHVVGYGSTWVVATAGGISDSVRVTVTQTLGSLSFTPMCSFLWQPMRVGDTVTFRLDRPGIDRSGASMPVDDSTLAAARASSSWRRAHPTAPVVVDISPTGVATAMTPGFDLVIGTYRLPGGSTDIELGCNIQVVQ